MVLRTADFPLSFEGPGSLASVMEANGVAGGGSDGSAAVRWEGTIMGVGRGGGGHCIPDEYTEDQQCWVLRTPRCGWLKCSAAHGG